MYIIITAYIPFVQEDARITKIILCDLCFCPPFTKCEITENSIDSKKHCNSLKITAADCDCVERMTMTITMSAKKLLLWWSWYEVMRFDNVWLLLLLILCILRAAAMVIIMKDISVHDLDHGDGEMNESQKL